MDIDQLIIDEENLARTVAAGRPTCASCFHWSPFNSVIKKIIQETPDGGFTVSGLGTGECWRVSAKEFRRSLRKSVSGNFERSELR